MKRELLRKGAIISIATMLIVIVIIPIINGAGNTEMGCYPSSNIVTVGETFSITVWLNADESIGAWLVDLLNFNETILGMANADSVSIDPYWRSGFYDNGTIHNSAGNITGIQAFIMTGSTANTTIFTVNFTAVKPGLCYINLTEAEAYSGGPNVLNNWYNTSLTIYPKEPTGLTTTTVGQNRIDLNWTKQTGMDKTHIRYKTGSNPISITDGTELYNGTGTSTSHTGLNPGDTIYYSAWGWNETAGLYSLNYDTAQGQTSIPPPNTIMGCYPSSNIVTVGETFNITVWLNADESIDSWLVDLLNFNETFLGMANADSVSIDPYWRSGFYDNGTIHNSAGNITGIQAFIMTGSTANTTIFTVNFTAVKPGLCYINLTEAKAYSGGPNVLNNWYNTSITIYPKTPTGLTTTTVNHTRIDLNWTKQTGMDKTHIRYKTGSNPISITDGTELYNGTGTSTSHTGLNPGDTIYYSAWGWNETAGLYSLNYDTAQGQTSIPPPNTIMGCYPSSNIVTVGETFNVTVWLNADESVDSWLVDLLNFNETILGLANADSVSIDPYWRSSGFYDNGTIHNSAGNITGIQAFITTGSTTNTTIFTVNFTAVKPGLCYINLTEAEAYSGGPNVLNNRYNTSVTIYPKTPTGLTTTTVDHTRIDLNWTKQTGMDKTHIRYKTGSNPISITDGTELYNGTGTSTSHTGLNPGDIIYYSAWGWNETAGLYSLNYDTAQGQTITDSPLLSNENPTDSSTNIDIMQSLVNVTITDVNGDPMDWTIEGQYIVNTGANGASNGSISANINTPLPYGITIIWYVNVTDGTSWTNETYVFTTENEPAPSNNAPVISDNVPTNGSYNISVGLSSLSVNIVDPDGDIFNWSIETSPDIGNSSYIGDVNGSKSCNISGLSYSANYVWFVNCSDGSVWTREVFSFTTETNESEETYTVYIDNNNTEGPWDGTSEHPYRSIQAGIDAVSIGGTVIVNNGTYNENLVITKSVNVIGAGAETTIVKNLNSDHVFYVTADRVNISGFTIEEAGFSKKAGICIDGADYCHISSNNVLNNYYGVRLKSSNSNILTGNNVFSNTKCGIFLEDSSSNTLVGNNVLSNTNGIYLTGSSGNTITGNNVSGNTNGIYFEVSSSNALTGNNVSGNTNGIYFEVSSSNALTGNNVSGNTNGIYLISSSDNVLTSNTISSNTGDGVNIRFSSGNSITDNMVLDNTYGIYLYSCSGNIICNNYFNNTNNAWDDGNNQWNVTTIISGTNIIGYHYLGGNYWHDYNGVDIDGDGLGDSLTPYTCSARIINGGDYYPLIKPATNNQPNRPSRPFGPTSGKPDKLYTYQTLATDPDGDKVYYKWDWGGDITSDWLGPYDSDEFCYGTHSWSSKGSYEIRVKAKDEYGAESDWSDPLPISMPRNNQLIRPLILQFLEKLMEHSPILEQILQPIYDRLAGL